MYVKALVAISEVSTQIIRQNPDFIPVMDYTRFLVISIGTGSNRSEQKYNSKLASKWGIMSWLYFDGSTPLINCYSEASTDMVEFYNCVVFQAFKSESSYLRIDVSNSHISCLFISNNLLKFFFLSFFFPLLFYLCGGC